MSNHLISIIIPTFNSEITIFKALTSVLEQTFQNYEVIIVDGVSIDRTLEIVKSFNDSRIRILCEKDNGIYDAMNKGLQLAKGEWIYFLGSDDELYGNDILEKVQRVISNTTSSFLYGNVEVSGFVEWSANDKIYDGVFDIRKLVNKNICHQSIFYKRKKIKAQELYFNTEYSICADWDFNLKCWSIEAFQYMPIIVAKFCGGGISSQKKHDSFIDEREFKFLEYFKYPSYVQLRKIFDIEQLKKISTVKKYRAFFLIENWFRKWKS